MASLDVRSWDAHIAEISGRFLALRAHGLDQGLRECMGITARMAGAERSHLALLGEEPEEPLSCFEWCAPGVASDPPSLGPEARHRHSGARDLIVSGRVLHLPSPEAIPADWSATRDDLLERGVRSLLGVPVRSDRRFLGYLSFECLERPRRWSDQEILRLQLVAGLFASAVQRCRFEAALQASEARFRALAQHAIELVAELGPDGRYLYVSPSYQEVLGYRPEELLGADCVPLVHPDDVHRCRRSFVEALRSQGVSRSVHRLRHRNGGWRWFDNTGRAFRGNDGETHFVSIGRDITERKQMEQALRESQEQLLQAQKMEAVGRLAGGIAHDFNNLLTVILGHAQLLSDAALADPEARASAHDIQTAAQRAAELTTQLLAFSRPSVLEVRRVTLNEVVEGLEPMLRRVLGEDLELVIECAPEISAVRADPNRLQQLLLNLVVNARDSMPEGGRVHVATGETQLDLASAVRLGLPGAGGYVTLSVRDTGVGMDPDTVSRIFEPFFTTKEPGKGTGLGLSIVYSVARDCAGGVQVESRPGGGSCFRVFLARARRREEEHPAPVAGPLLLGTETVLVVEDEPAVRRLVSRSLARAGYEVLEASNGHQALEVADAYPGPIDLLVTDLVMPRMRGRRLARELVARRPALRVLFISGYPDERAPTAGPGPPGSAHLAKPFGESALLGKIRELLDQRDAQA